MHAQRHKCATQTRNDERAFFDAVVRALSSAERVSNEPPPCARAPASCQAAGVCFRFH